MEKNKMKITLLPGHFVKDDGTFDKEKAIKLGGQIAGICYNKEGFEALLKEPEKTSIKRGKLTLNMRHHSIFDHIIVLFNLQRIPKIVAMVLNNEAPYTTSEKSLRYTPVIKKAGSTITDVEERLYNEWKTIIKEEASREYGHIHNDGKLEKLAQENARYFVTVFVPTEMIYSTSFRQINYIASWIMKYIKNADKNDLFTRKLIPYFADFISQLESLNILEEALLQNEKERSLSLFAKNLDKKVLYFGDTYSTIYKGSWAELAHLHRHRTIDYSMERLDENDCFVPLLIADNPELSKKWKEDMKLVYDVFPQGQLINIYESGSFENFILKAKERICSAAQLETMLQTRATLLEYKKALEDSNHPLASEMALYAKGARCTFPDYTCPSNCGFAEGINLTRRL